MAGLINGGSPLPGVNGASSIGGPGSNPAQLALNLPPKTLIYNQSKTNKVWLSSQSSVTPGTGMPLGALGFILWTGPLWVVPDPANVGVTPVSWNSNSSDPNNPVDEGAAIAVAIAALGIPLTLLETTLYNNTIAAGGTTGAIPVTPYASLIISFQGIGPLANELILNWGFNDASGNGAGTGQIIISAGLSPHDAYVIPVTGTVFAMTNPTANVTPSNISIDGTNRTFDLGTGAVGLTQAPGIFSAVATGAFLVGSTTRLNVSTGDGVTSLGTYMVASGLIQFEFSIPNATAKGQFALLDPNGYSMEVTDTSETGWHTIGAATQRMYKTIPIPNDGARYNWVYESNTAPGASITIAVKWAA